jgi:ABC-2 type transport system permease protein
MRPLLALWKKESLLLIRDWHALLLLFAMPAAFILVMSLALEGRFDARGKVGATWVWVDEDDSALSRDLLARLESGGAFRRVQPTGDVEAALRSGRVQFRLRVPKGWSDPRRQAAPPKLELSVAPDTEAALRELFRAEIAARYGELRRAQALDRLRRSVGRLDPKLEALFAAGTPDAVLELRGVQERGAPLPSAVQQNVPAWLLFAMFFISVPLSTTWIQERQQGTLLRLRSLGIGPATLLAGKLLPYGVVNLCQAATMLGVGVWAVPALGGRRLDLGVEPGALLAVIGLASFAAVAWGLMVANWAGSAEQATVFSGVANLLMGAVGGVMVPRFIMPAVLQKASEASPMAWGLDAFLDVLLRRGGLELAAPQLWRLGLFGLGCLLLAGLGLRRR